MIDLDGRVALVTGGSRGIGAAAAKALAQAGAVVAITYTSNRKRARSVAEQVAAIGRECLSIKANVSSSIEVHRAVKIVRDTYRRVDILVNNAGIWKRASIGSMTEKEWDETMDVNLKGTFFFCREVAPLMKKRRRGKIINISSTAGQRGEPHYSHYAASKGGMIAFTKSIAVELAPFNVNVNCIAPGWVDTDMTASALRSRAMQKEIPTIIPRGRVATPEEIASSVLFLASDLSNHYVGAILSVNGGGVLYG